MKYAKMLGLLAVAAAALMAFAGVASATEVTSPPGTIYTGAIKAESEGTTTLHNTSIGISVSCAKSTVEGTVEQHGSGVTVKGAIPKEKLTFTECGGDTVTVIKEGSLEVHSISGSTNGTLTSVGAEITIKTASGVSCTYTTGTGTDVGTLTSTTHLKSTEKASTTATLDINSATIPRTGDSILCGTKGQWTGSYIVTTPDSLDVS